MDFITKFEKITSKNNSLLCVGLDPEIEKLRRVYKGFSLTKKGEFLLGFNKYIIDSTADFVCAFKPNTAFYEAYGLEGLEQLKKTVDYLHKSHPDIPLILDAKRADIPNTARMYAKAVFDYWQTDAVTVYPHLGFDSLKPFFDYQDKLTIVLLKTSNPGSSSFQNLEIDGKPYYLKMALEIKKWKVDNCGIFVGATYPRELEELRAIFRENIFLSAGIGAQSANIKSAVKAGIDKNGGGIILNASRSIIYANNPRKAAKDLRDEINKFRSK